MIRRLIILLLIVGCVFAEQYEVVVILKNGSEIHGIIIEEKPYEYIKIQSGKNVFVFEFEEIELLTKELVSDKTWSFAGGFGTNRSLSLLGISKDFRIGNNFSFFLTAGIGTAMPGLGFAYQSDYNNNGFSFSLSFGKWEDEFYRGGYGYEDEWVDNKMMCFSYQIRNRTGNPSFWNVGIYLYYEKYVYYDYWDDNQTFYGPIISWDYRF